MVVPTLKQPECNRQERMHLYAYFFAFERFAAVLAERKIDCLLILLRLGTAGLAPDRRLPAGMKPELDQ